MKTVIHVNQHAIRLNRKRGTNDPVLTIKTYKTNDYAHEASIINREGVVVAKIIYRPDKPLSCGATCWVETHLEVVDGINSS